MRPRFIDFSNQDLPDFLDSAVNVWWLSNRASGSVPRRDQFDIVDFDPAYWSAVSISKYEPDIDDYRFGVYSAIAQRASNKILTGKLFLETLAPPVRGIVSQYYDFLTRNKCRGAFFGSPLLGGDDWKAFSTLQFPIQYEDTSGFIHVSCLYTQSDMDEIQDKLDGSELTEFVANP